MDEAGSMSPDATGEELDLGQPLKGRVRVPDVVASVERRALTFAGAGARMGRLGWVLVSLTGIDPAP